MDDKYRRLIELGAGDFEHVDASLIARLEGTRCLLKAWCAPNVLKEASLYHVAYGTDSFPLSLVGVEQRKDVIDVIGEEVESIIYHFCACDKELFYAQFGKVEQPIFYDRFTDQSTVLPLTLLCYVCELTVANEIDIALHTSNYTAERSAELFALFTRMHEFLSIGAKRKIQQVFAPGN